MENEDSIPCGSVENPLPDGTLANATTLEVTRLDIAAGETTTEDYTHIGAAVYAVESGSVTVTFQTQAQNVLLFTSDDPLQAPVVAECQAGCTLGKGHWFSFDTNLTLSLSADADDGAALLIVSLTPHNMGATAELETPGTEATRRVVITRDSGIFRPLDT